MKKNINLHLSRITMTKSKNYATKNIRTRYSTLKKKKSNHVYQNNVMEYIISIEERARD